MGEEAARLTPAPILPAASAPEAKVTEASVDMVAPGAVDPALINPRVADFEAYLPPRLLGPDSIRPIYEPEFVSAAEAPLTDDELVLAIELAGEARAYPITVLRFREMVNDELAGLPILVTW